MDPSKPPKSDSPEQPTPSAELPEFVEDSSFLRLFVFEKNFRLAVVFFIFLCIGLGFFLPKWWITSPPGFLPEVRTSGLDKVQSWSLRRSAIKSAAAGQIDEAVHTWRMAIFEDPCNPTNSQGLLNTLVRINPPPVGYQRVGIFQAQWLMRLRRTNQADLDLVALLFDHYQLSDLVVAVLVPKADSLTPVQAGLLLKALYQVQDMERFSTVWNGYPSLHTNTLFKVYRAAWQAGWGPPGSIRQGRDSLEKAISNPDTRLLALQLQLSISYALNDLGAYTQAFDALETDHATRVKDHAYLWRLLVRTGKSAEAESRLRRFSNPPTTPLECSLITETYAMLGRPEEASVYLGKHIHLFGGQLELWIRQAELLITTAKWDRLRELALELRQVEGLRDHVAGFAWYLEGLSELRRNRTVAADRAFQLVLSETISDPLLGFQTATSLAQLERPELARKLLNRLQANFNDKAEYWLQVMMAAYGDNDIEAMLAAAEKAYAIAPNNPVIMNNYAAALIIMRQRPGEAVKLTLNKLTASPGDLGATLNHALALLQNDRLNEVQAILVRIDPNQLDGIHFSVYQLAQFELNLRRGDFLRASAAANQVDRRFLKAPQIRWFDEALKKLPAQK
jgi:tetratricopeptide (TPR) repeat protein